MRNKKYSLLALCVLVVAGCDFGNAGFLVPSPPEPGEVPQIGGIWRGTDTIKEVHYGDCLNSVMQSRIGTVSELELSIQQSGVSLSGTSTQSADGTACPFAGQFAFAWSFSLDTVATCNSRSVTGLICPNGEVRDLKHVSETVVAGAEGRLLTGRRTIAYSVWTPGAQQALGPLTLISTIRLERQEP